MPFRNFPTTTHNYRHPSCEFLGFCRNAGDVSVLLGQRASSLGTNRAGTRYSILQERRPQLQSNLHTHKLQYNTDWMKIRCSVSTYLLLKVSVSFPAARIAKDFTHRRKLPCGSFETDPTKKPEFRDNHASLTVAKY